MFQRSDFNLITSDDLAKVYNRTDGFSLYDQTIHGSQTIASTALASSGNLLASSKHNQSGKSHNKDLLTITFGDSNLDEFYNDNRLDSSSRFLSTYPARSKWVYVLTKFQAQNYNLQVNVPKDQHGLLVLPSASRCVGACVSISVSSNWQSSLTICTANPISELLEMSFSCGMDIRNNGHIFAVKRITNNTTSSVYLPPFNLKPGVDTNTLLSYPRGKLDFFSDGHKWLITGEVMNEVSDAINNVLFPGETVSGVQSLTEGTGIVVDMGDGQAPVIGLANVEELQNSNVLLMVDQHGRVTNSESGEMTGGMGYAYIEDQVGRTVELQTGTRFEMWRLQITPSSIESNIVLEFSSHISCPLAENSDAMLILQRQEYGEDDWTDIGSGNGNVGVGAWLGCSILPSESAHRQRPVCGIYVDHPNTQHQVTYRILLAPFGLGFQQFSFGHAHESLSGNDYITCPTVFQATEVIPIDPSDPRGIRTHRDGLRQIQYSNMQIPFVHNINSGASVVLPDSLVTITPRNNSSKFFIRFATMVTTDAVINPADEVNWRLIRHFIHLERKIGEDSNWVRISGDAENRCWIDASTMAHVGENWSGKFGRSVYGCFMDIPTTGYDVSYRITLDKEFGTIAYFGTCHPNVERVINVPSVLVVSEYESTPQSQYRESNTNTLRRETGPISIASSQLMDAGVDRHANLVRWELTRVSVWPKSEKSVFQIYVSSGATADTAAVARNILSVRRVVWDGSPLEEAGTHNVCGGSAVGTSQGFTRAVCNASHTPAGEPFNALQINGLYSLTIDKPCLHGVRVDYVLDLHSQNSTLLAGANNILFPTTFIVTETIPYEEVVHSLLAPRKPLKSVHGVLDSAKDFVIPLYPYSNSIPLKVIINARSSHPTSGGWEFMTQTYANGPTALVDIGRADHDIVATSEISLYQRFYLEIRIDKPRRSMIPRHMHITGHYIVHDIEAVGSIRRVPVNVVCEVPPGEDPDHSIDQVTNELYGLYLNRRNSGELHYSVDIYHD